MQKELRLHLRGRSSIELLRRMDASLVKVLIHCSAAIRVKSSLRIRKAQKSPTRAFAANWRFVRICFVQLERSERPVYNFPAIPWLSG